MYNISFVITIFNTKKTDLEILIDSFKNDFSLFEFIFIDDASTNREAINFLKQKFQSKHQNVKIFELDQNTKRYGAFVKGLKEATGKYIHSLDSDDWVKIKNLVKLNKKLIYIDDDALVFPNYIQRKKMKYRRNPWAFFSKKVLKNHKWNYTWPNFAAYNIAIKKTTINNINFPSGIKGPHDDAFFGQLYIHYAKSVRFINLCWFVYRFVPSQRFSGKTAVAKNFEAHEHLLFETIKLIKPTNPLTYIPFHSLLISHIRGMSLLKSETEIEEWFNSLKENTLLKEIKNTSYWKKMYFYKKTKNQLDKLKKIF